MIFKQKVLAKYSLNQAVVISAFPGCGKTHFYNQMKNSGHAVLDSDSSKFDKKEFPQNYISHIKNQLNTADVILVSSHQEVRDALVANGIEFVLVYPGLEQKEEYLRRYKERGSDEKFIEFIDKNWDKFHEDIEAQQGCSKLKLGKKYLSDVLN